MEKRHIHKNSTSIYREGFQPPSLARENLKDDKKTAWQVAIFNIIVQQSCKHYMALFPGKPHDLIVGKYK